MKMQISFEGTSEEFNVQATLGSRADADRLVKVLNEISLSLWPYREPPPLTAPDSAGEVEMPI